MIAHRQNITLYRAVVFLVVATFVNLTIFSSVVTCHIHHDASQAVHDNMTVCHSQSEEQRESRNCQDLETPLVHLLENYKDSTARLIFVKLFASVFSLPNLDLFVKRSSSAQLECAYPALPFIEYLSFFTHSPPLFS